MPLAYPVGHGGRASGLSQLAVAFDVSHLGTVRVAGPRRLRPPAALVEQRPAARSIRAGPSTPTCSTRTGSSSTTSSCGGSTRSASTSCPTPRTRATSSRPSAATTSREERAIIAVQGPEARARLARVSPAGCGGPPLRRGAVRVGRRHLPGRGHRVHGGGRRRVRGARPRSRSASGTRSSRQGVLPAGLGARDTLRLEAGLPAARPRARTRHHPAPGRAGLGDRLGQGGFHRTRRARGGAGQWPGPAPARLRGGRPAAAARRCRYSARRRTGSAP